MRLVFLPTLCSRAMDCTPVVCLICFLDHTNLPRLATAIKRRGGSSGTAALNYTHRRKRGVFNGRIIHEHLRFPKVKCLILAITRFSTSFKG